MDIFKKTLHVIQRPRSASFGGGSPGGEMTIGSPTNFDHSLKVGTKGFMTENIMQFK